MAAAVADTTPADDMSADVLRRAAALMRERAQAATSSPWSSGLTGIYGGPDEFYIAKWDDNSQTPVTADRMHIASWHPAVALGVADWLDYTADRHEEHTIGLALVGRAVAVARTYLGSDA